jgi:EAL domain-containing protein (putative c-di-GMP-specific phosphodiesterase class I)
MFAQYDQTDTTTALTTTAPAPAPPPGRGESHRHGRAEAAQRRRLQRDLAAATASGGFVLHYQPRLALASGRRTGAEARISWLRQRHGLVSASAFLPLADGAGLTAEIGGWMLRAACVEAAAWPTGTVSVQVSPRQLVDQALSRQIAEALDASNLVPERLELAFGEAVLAHVDTDTLLLMSAIRDLGIGIAVDDFGAGVASLSMVKRLPLTAMKLARTLVRQVTTDWEDAAIVRAVIETGHALGLSMVADGIESELQRSFLARGGCDEGQGALFGHKLTAAALRASI